MNVSTVESAQACLRLLTGSKIPLHVFIAGSKGDMDRFTRLHDKITKLLKRLSGFGPNIVRCQVWDPSDRMCDLLKGRALTLEYLDIGVTGRTSVFSGPLQSLRTLVIRTSSSKLWCPSVLPALSSLSIAYAGGPTGTSLRALTDLLQGLPQLQNLHLDNFGRWIPGKRFLPRSGLVSTTLHNLSFTNCDFPPVLQYLSAPDLRSFLIHGTHPDSDATPLPFFQDPALLWRVQAAPILEKRGLCAITTTVRQEPTKRSLVIEISGNGLQFLVRLEWFRWRQGDWERWVENSCRNLLQRPQFPPSISLIVDSDGPFIATLYPILSLLCVKALTIVGGPLREILQYLAVPDQLSYRLRFPVLKILDLMAYASLTVQEGSQIRSYLQFRAGAGAPVRVMVRSSTWRETRGFPWTSFMTADSTHSTTTLVLRQ